MYLVNKAAAGLERTDSSFERSSGGKMLSDGITCYREIVHEGSSPSVWATSLLFYFKKLPKPP